MQGRGYATGSVFVFFMKEEMPEASEGEHSNLSTIGFALGFELMMLPDVVLG